MKKQRHREIKNDVVSIESIEQRIYLIRGQKVMIDIDLAGLYGVTTSVLNQAVKRNLVRFPDDFMFQLSEAELENLRSQSVISSWGGRRYLPYAFTEHGVAMLSSILNSDRAILVNVAIMRTFVKLREIMSTRKDLARQIDALEGKYAKHDQQIQIIFDAIRKLLQPAVPPKRRIGFHSP